MQRTGSRVGGRVMTSELIICPLATQTDQSMLEAAAPAGADSSLKAYKLGKRRWSYNQCQLVVQQEGGNEQLTVMEAMAHGQDSLDPEYQESGVVYLVRLSNDQRVRVHVFVVHDTPEVIQHASKPNEDTYQWTLVNRSSCKKGCQGPILRAIQRYGRLGRRSGAPEAEACEPVEELVTSSKAGRQRSKTVKAAAATVGPRWDVELKDARYLYLSVDEASTHVGKRFFRLLTGVYTHDGSCLLGTSVSQRIRVLANNDVPTGAAFIPLIVPVAYGWDGWVAGEGEDRGPCAPRDRRSQQAGGGNNMSPSTPTRRPPAKGDPTWSQSSSDTSQSGHHLVGLPPGLGLQSHAQPRNTCTGWSMASRSPHLDSGRGDDLEMRLPTAAVAGLHSFRSANDDQGVCPGEHEYRREFSAAPPPPPLRPRQYNSYSQEDRMAPQGVHHTSHGCSQGADRRLSLQLPAAGAHVTSALHLTSCRWTVSPNVHSSMARPSSDGALLSSTTSHGSGSFKRCRQEGDACPAAPSATGSDSPSPFRAPACAPSQSISRSPGDHPDSATGSVPSPEAGQRQQAAALHRRMQQNHVVSGQDDSRGGWPGAQYCRPQLSFVRSNLVDASPLLHSRAASAGDAAGAGTSGARERPTLDPDCHYAYDGDSIGVRRGSSYQHFSYLDHEPNFGGGAGVPGLMRNVSSDTLSLQRQRSAEARGGSTEARFNNPSNHRSSAADAGAADLFDQPGAAADAAQQWWPHTGPPPRGKPGGGSVARCGGAPLRGGPACAAPPPALHCQGSAEAGLQAGGLGKAPSADAVPGRGCELRPHSILSNSLPEHLPQSGDDEDVLLPYASAIERQGCLRDGDGPVGRQARGQSLPGPLHNAHTMPAGSTMLNEIAEWLLLSAEHSPLCPSPVATTHISTRHADGNTKGSRAVVATPRLTPSPLLSSGLWSSPIKLEPSSAGDGDDSGGMSFLAGSRAGSLELAISDAMVMRGLQDDREPRDC